jgi:hypothetical protein
MSDLTAAAEFYANPENVEPVGPPRRPHHRQLTSHVPVRFDPVTIASIRMLASREGVSVSSWIRTCVEREVRHQLPLQLTAGQVPVESVQKPGLPATLNPYSYLNRVPELIAAR